jgi:hypothetical protein
MRAAHERRVRFRLQKVCGIQPPKLALRVSCRRRRKPQLSARAAVTKQYEIVIAEIMLTSIVSTPPCRDILYCAITSISKVSSTSRAILSVVPVCVARLKRNSHIASDAGVAKTILAALLVAESELNWLSTNQEHHTTGLQRPSLLLSSTPSMQAWRFFIIFSGSV